LRPSGKVLIADAVVDVVSDGEFLEPGTNVRVSSVAGDKIVVVRVA
jgi:membrane-bound serine protease (ClpP class)